MYSVMIVDDEKTIREKLALVIPFEEHGFTVRASARNGEEAWHLLPQVRPRLILLDIRMPVMDGLDFLARLRDSEYADTRVIILSGYSEFSYAQKAIAYGIKGYLTKPVDEEEAEKLLELIREELAKEEQARQNADYQALRHELRLAYDNDTAMSPHPEYFFLHIALCGMQEDRKSDSPGVMLGSVMKDFTRLPYNTYVTREKGVYTYALPLACVPSGDMGAFCAALRRKMARAGLICLCMADTETLAHTAVSYRRQYQQALSRLLTGAFYGEERDDAQHARGAASLEPLVNELRRAIWRLDDSQVLAAFTEIEAFMAARQPGIATVHELSCRICAILQEAAWRHSQNSLADSPGLSPVWTEKSGLFLTFDMWRHLQRQQLTDTLRHIRQAQSAASLGVCGELMEYVQQHYMESLSLQRVAEVFHMNAAYLGRVFQKATGENFRQYVNSLRIDQAKQLLKSTDLMIYEIAEKVGFSDSAYFVSRFTAMVGMTPLEFRRK